MYEERGQDGNVWRMYGDSLVKDVMVTNRGMAVLQRSI